MWHLVINLIRYYVEHKMKLYNPGHIDLQSRVNAMVWLNLIELIFYVFVKI